MRSYHAYDGRTFCYQKAERTCKGMFYTKPRQEAPLRTRESILSDMQEASQNINHSNKKRRVFKGTK